MRNDVDRMLLFWNLQITFVKMNCKFYLFQRWVYVTTPVLDETQLQTGSDIIKVTPSSSSCSDDLEMQKVKLAQ